MKKILNLRIVIALLLAAAPLAGTAQTTFFTDNFSNGSTTNMTSIMGGGPTASYTSYDIASTKNTFPATNGCTIAPNDLHLALAASTTSGFLEAQALFVTNSVNGTNAIALSQPGDYIDIVVVFTNTSGLLANTTSTLWLGLYNSGGNYPVAGGGLAEGGNNTLSTTSGSPYAAGNCASWQGYVAQIENGGSGSRITTRPLQNGSGTTSANQELCGNNVGGGAFNNPGAVTIETASGSPSFTFTPGGEYTNELRFTITGPNVMTVSNYLYGGPGAAVGGLIFSQESTNISTTNFLTSAFDGLAIGALNKASTYNPIMDISSILITGQSTVITTPPTITLQPVSVTVATNGSCAFLVNAVGFDVTYQWHRNGTNLLNQGNISGVTGSGGSSTLVVSPAGLNDMLSTNNGYYVTVTGAGGYSTNSTTNSLTLVAATNLIWNNHAANLTWDLGSSVNWQDTNGNLTVFTCGDPVTFDNTGGGGTVTLTGTYLSAASVTVNKTGAGKPYVFSGGGSFAGPGNLIYKGTAQLTINNANTYSGGTIISNASANLYLENYAGLGTGPVTLVSGATPGLEVSLAGGASTGIPDIIVPNDFTIQYDALGSYALVLSGNLSGASDATLTFQEYSAITGSGTNNRVRVYGNYTTNNAIIDLPDADTVLAPYNTGGFQVYNGLIEGSGTVEEKGYAIFTFANTFAGGNPGGMYLAAGNTGVGADSTGSAGAPGSGPLGVGTLLLWVDSTSASPANNAGIFASGGDRTIYNAIQYPSSTNNLTLIVNGTNNLTFTGPMTLNGNDAFYTNPLPANMVIYTNRTIQVTNTALTTFSGVISDATNDGSGNFISAGMGLTETGSGVLALNNTETYTGPTTASGGTLQVNGALNQASAVTVNSNATLSGTGTIYGPVAVNAGGAIAAGAASIGTLNINNNLTNNGNVFIRVNKSLSPAQSNDIISVTGVLTNTGAGTVTVTNLGSALQVGNALFLFNKAMSNSAALTVIGGGVAWSNKLAINGSIVVVSPPDVGVQSSSPASVALGANITNTLTVTNIGPGSAFGIIVTDTLPANVTFVSASSSGTTNANAGQVVWSGISLGVNTSSNLTLVVNAPTAGNVTNTASVVSSASDPNLANNTATNLITVLPPVDTGVILSGPLNAALGSGFSWTLTVTNGGPGTASGILVTDTMPANVTFVSASNGGTTNGNASARQVTWGAFTLVVNTTTNFTVNVIAAAGGNATNKASVVSSASDPNLVNNLATNVTVIPSTIIPQVSAHIGSFSMVGTNVVIGGTNGVNGGTYYLLDSTDVAKPLSQWMPVWTNVVNTNGASGAFTFTATNVVTPNGVQQFYILSNTNN